jgi:hypothetical protein
MGYWKAAKMSNKAMALPDPLSSGGRSTERGNLTVFLGFMQGVIFPAGARALPARNPSISQEIMIKPFLNCSWRKKYYCI